MMRRGWSKTYTRKSSTGKKEGRKVAHCGAYVKKV